MRGLRRDDQVGPDQPQIVTLPRAEHHAMLTQTDGLAVPVNGRMAHREKRHQTIDPVRGPAIWSSEISSVQTRKLSSVLGPKVVAIATSEASRPRAIRMRRMRGILLRGSNMCQRPPIQTSNHAAKSPTPYGGGIPTSP